MSEFWSEFHKQLNPMLQAIKKIEEQNKRLAGASESLLSGINVDTKEFLAKANLGKPFQDLALKASILESQITSISLPDYSSLARSLYGNQKMFDAWLKKFPFKEILDALARETPYNFADLLIQEQLELIGIAARLNFGIVECIPTEILKEILSVKDNDSSINIILLDHKSSILDSCLEIASHIIEGSSGKDKYAELLIQGIESLRSGMYAPAQALLTVLWDSYLVEEANSNNPMSRIKETRLAKSDLLALASLSDIYTHAAYAPAVKAYQNDPLKSRYSRHGTVHYATRNHFSLENAICALTIATGLLGRNWRIS